MQSTDVEKTGDGGANAMPPTISTFPSRQSYMLGDRNPQDSVKEDLNVIEQDVIDHAPAVRLEMDFRRLLDDCEEYLGALLEDDYDAIRRTLSKVLHERDGHRDVELEKVLLKQEEDLTVRVSGFLKI